MRRSYTPTERSDNYMNTLIELTDRWRVILCKDCIQFIIQRRSVLSPNTGTWAGKRYCTTKMALIRDCSELNLISRPETRQLLDHLPDSASKLK